MQECPLRFKVIGARVDYSFISKGSHVWRLSNQGLYESRHEISHLASSLARSNEKEKQKEDSVLGTFNNPGAYVGARNKRNHNSIKNEACIHAAKADQINKSGAFFCRLFTDWATFGVGCKIIIHSSLVSLMRVPSLSAMICTPLFWQLRIHRDGGTE